MKRSKKIGASISLLLACVSGTTCWVGAHIWANEWVVITLQEPKSAILTVEVITLGLVTLFGIFGVVYFLRRRG